MSNIACSSGVMPASAAALTAESIVLCYQIRTLDKRRLTRKFGTVDTDQVVCGSSQCGWCLRFPATESR
ncbi:MAG: type II toxin-antitoxin system PemK/MazF family toxin [Pyrinomonadaceae bacterium]|nr:type II toxin-antitoxin system PemK/MazF family toxin [Pyrinomonadaceae bacterium]